MTVRNFIRSAVVLLACLGQGPVAWGYGSGGGSSSCDRPKFLKPVPADGSTVPSLSEFAFLASSTDTATLVVQIDGATTPTEIQPLPSGDLQVKVRPPTPIDKPGRVRISAEGKSREGCATFNAFYITVQP